MEFLALSWGLIIAFGVILYVLLGGFDLGIGILSILIRDPHQKDIAVSTILPVWDGNQTWLVFGGAALYGAFPLAFSTILPLMYIPILVMVISLLFRGITFEFRLKAERSKAAWDIAYFAGSIFAVIAQGLILGTFIKGFTLLDLSNLHVFYPWLNSFGFMCSIGLVLGYSLLGSNYLIIKTTGKLQELSYKISSCLQYLILLCFIAVSIWSPYLDPAIKARWFNPDYMPFLAILPLTTVGLFIYHWYSLRKRHEIAPFWCAIGMFLTCYIGFIISIYPYIVPRHITYLEAASGKSSLQFMLVGAVIMLPVLLFYTFHSYRIFRGKVTEPIKY